MPRTPTIASAEGASLPYRLGVGMVIVNADNLVFVARRIDTTSEAWQMPQGGIDPGESPLSAAYRELEEETGLRPGAIELLHTIPEPLSYDLPVELVPKLWKGHYRGQKQHWFVFRLLADDTAINIHTAEPEFSEWKWVQPAELPALIVPFKRALYTELQAHLLQLIKS